MATKELLTMLFERGNAMQSFWGFYITVAGALLAFFGSAQRSKNLAIALSLLFVAFAAVNGNGMYDIARQRHSIFQIMIAKPTAPNDDWLSATSSAKNKRDLICASQPPTPLGVAAFHIASDLGVLAAIWLLTLLPRESDFFKKGPTI
ncbi:MAG: hypothetical protein QOF63_3210 [Thermoanaerobaculia bacterium]|jgi:hypothetical protein|nr:hypothetical protein [Thermoanaerobaculia bacterium]